MKDQLPLDDKEEIDIIPLLVPEEDKAPSGMHAPAGDVMWNFQYADDDLTKEALGLTSIPASLNGGEILDFKGIPEEPGLSREQGDGEEISYYGISESPPDEVPRKTEIYQDKISCLLILQSFFRKEGMIDYCNRLQFLIKEVYNVK